MSRYLRTNKYTHMGRLLARESGFVGWLVIFGGLYRGAGDEQSLVTRFRPDSQGHAFESSIVKMLERR